MRIAPEVNYIGIRTNETILPKISPSNANLNARASQETISRMQRERTYIDALTIAQSSRDIIQKALTISSQLMGLASNAMATGRIDQDQLSDHIQSINSVIGNYGEVVSTPVTGDTQPQVRDEQVRVNENFTQLRDIAVNVQAGRPVAPKDFEPVTTNLNTAASELDAKINNYLRDLGSTSRNSNYQDLNRNIGTVIFNNPVSALEAQGNINYEIAKKLTIT